MNRSNLPASSSTSTETSANTQTSAMVSINELMRMEEEREAEERAKHEARQARIRMEAEQQRLAKLEKERADLAAAEEKRRADAAREREAEARRVAEAQALVEQARFTAAEAARIEQLKITLAYEREVEHEKAKVAAQSKRQLFVGLGAAAALVIAGSLGVYFGKIRPDQMAQLAERERASADSTAQVSALQGKLEGAGADSDANAATIADLRAKIDALRSQMNAMPTASPQASAAGPTATTWSGRTPIVPPTVKTVDHPKRRPCVTEYEKSDPVNAANCEQ